MVGLEAEPMVHTTDVLIIGGGGAGAFAAIKAKEAGAKEVLLIDKAQAGKSGCTTFGAGVIKVFFPDEDDYDLWFKAAVETGYYLNDQTWLEIHLSEISKRIFEMESFGVEFEKTPEGKYRRVLARGASEKKPISVIMFHGPQMMATMRAEVIRRGVRVLDRVMATDLLTAGNRVVGAIGFETDTGQFQLVKSRATVLATGGQSFKCAFMGNKMVTGDAHVMALNAGADLMHYELTENHVAGADFDTLGMNMLVGHGGIFLNNNGERFMPRYDPELKEHALLYRLSGAMAAEVRQGRGPIYFDLTHFEPETISLFRKVLPLASRILERAGALKGDKIVRKLEWKPTFMGNIASGGGIKIDLKCESSLPGLFAVGDAACSLPSGAEGVGAYAIPFALTSGARAGLFAAEFAKEVDFGKIDEQQVEALKKNLYAPLKLKQGTEPDHVTLSIQEALFPMDIYIFRHEERLKKTLRTIETIRDQDVPMLKAYDPHYLRMALEAKNMAVCAELFLRSALARRDSRGSHLREDYPCVDNIDWLKWVIAFKRNGKIEIRTEDIPIDNYRLKPKRERVLHPIMAAMR